jgi:hypothetical protein
VTWPVPAPGSRRAPAGERGTATAETAVVLPALALLLMLCLWAVGVVGRQVQCVDAARIGARAMARGEARSAVVTAVERAAPDGATVSIQTVDGLVAVHVGASAGLPGPWRGSGPSVRLHSSAVASLEGR